MSIIYTFDEPEWFAQDYADDGDAVIGSAYGFHSPSNALSVGPAAPGASYGGDAAIFGLIGLPPLNVGSLYVVREFLDGDLAHESTPFNLFITDGVTEVVNDVVPKSQLAGPGMQSVFAGAFVLPPGVGALSLFAGLFNFRSQDPANLTQGRWTVDDISIEEETDVAKRSRWLAHQRLVTVLKGINGAAGGYHLNIGNRCFTKYVRPVGSTHPVLPYLCVPLVNTNPRVLHDNTSIKHTWTLPIMAFVAETNPGAFDSDAIAAIYHLQEDVYKAVMQDPTLNGTVGPVSFISGGVEEGGISPFDGLPYADAVIPIDLAIYLGLDVLGP